MSKPRRSFAMLSTINPVGMCQVGQRIGTGGDSQYTSNLAKEARTAEED